MADLKSLSPAALKAAMTGGTSEWGQRGSAAEHARYMEPVHSTSRRRCHCGCKTRAAWRGMANGIALMSGCELSVRRWMKGGVNG